MRTLHTASPFQSKTSRFWLSTQSGTHPSGEVNVHWNILFMTIPAVACGGQISPFINNRVDGEKMKVFLSFVFVGVLLLWRSFGG